MDFIQVYRDGEEEALFSFDPNMQSFEKAESIIEDAYNGEYSTVWDDKEEFLESCGIERVVISYEINL